MVISNIKFPTNEDMKLTESGEQIHQASKPKIRKLNPPMQAKITLSKRFIFCLIATRIKPVKVAKKVANKIGKKTIVGSVAPSAIARQPIILTGIMVKPDVFKTKKSPALLAEPSVPSSLNPDSNDREYNQYWPEGRTNHYWFDLNRDYLPNQLIETKAKILTYTDWLPNIMTDHHEMGTNSSFFFQPGVQERKNPLISDLNQELTREIGTYHEDALNEIGSLYYSEEDYDDFYFGKGSSYPDINGGIGILFEQGSSRGHIQESVNGILTFPFTIRNQLTAAFSKFIFVLAKNFNSSRINLIPFPNAQFIYNTYFFILSKSFL